MDHQSQSLSPGPSKSQVEPHLDHYHHHHLFLTTPKPPRNSPLSLSRLLLHCTIDLVDSSIELIPSFLAEPIELLLAIFELLSAFFQLLLAVVDEGGDALV
jgi:hypothetical protein